MTRIRLVLMLHFFNDCTVFAEDTVVSTVSFGGQSSTDDKLDCLMKRLDCSVVLKVKFIGKVQNSSDSSSERYLLNC